MQCFLKKQVIELKWISNSIEIEKFAKTNKNSFRVRFFIKYNLHITDTLEIMYLLESLFELFPNYNKLSLIYLFQFCLLIAIF